MKIVEYILIWKFRMDKLKLLHERVKSHPYRINRDEEYLNSYQNLLYNLADAFYDVIKETEYKNASNMLHDFMASIRNIYSKDSGHIYHIERCIGTIHEFLDTKEVNSYWTYYTGVNSPESLPRNIKYEFVDNKYYPVLKGYERDRAIEEIREKIEKNPKFKNLYLLELKWLENAITRD